MSNHSYKARQHAQRVGNQAQLGPIESGHIKLGSCGAGWHSNGGWSAGFRVGASFSDTLCINDSQGTGNPCWALQSSNRPWAPCRSSHSHHGQLAGLQGRPLSSALQAPCYALTSILCHLDAVLPLVGTAYSCQLLESCWCHVRCTAICSVDADEALAQVQEALQAATHYWQAAPQAADAKAAVFSVAGEKLRWRPRQTIWFHALQPKRSLQSLALPACLACNAQSRGAPVLTHFTAVADSSWRSAGGADA